MDLERLEGGLPSRATALGKALVFPPRFAPPHHADREPQWTGKEAHVLPYEAPFPLGTLVPTLERVLPA